MERHYGENRASPLSFLAMSEKERKKRSTYVKKKAPDHSSSNRREKRDDCVGSPERFCKRGKKQCARCVWHQNKAKQDGMIAAAARALSAKKEKKAPYNYFLW